jgi:predicted metal-dependent hydrolase
VRVSRDGVHSQALADASLRSLRCGEAILQRWYREQLRELIPALVKKWERRLGVGAADWRIKKMKTKWGSCTREARRIWLNLDLAKKPVPCIEYIVVHEMVHLRERHHGDCRGC